MGTFLHAFRCSIATTAVNLALFLLINTPLHHTLALLLQLHVRVRLAAVDHLPVTHMKNWPFVARSKIHGMRAFAETLPQHDSLQIDKGRVVVLDLDPMDPCSAFSRLNLYQKCLNSPPHTYFMSYPLLHYFLRQRRLHLHRRPC